MCKRLPWLNQQQTAVKPFSVRSVHLKVGRGLLSDAEVHPLSFMLLYHLKLIVVVPTASIKYYFYTRFWKGDFGTFVWCGVLLPSRECPGTYALKGNERWVESYFFWFPQRWTLEQKLVHGTDLSVSLILLCCLNREHELVSLVHLNHQHFLRIMTDPGLHTLTHWL